MRFIQFFDFDGSRPANHQCVRVMIIGAPSESALVGKQALIENQYVEF